MGDALPPREAPAQNEGKQDGLWGVFPSFLIMAKKACERCRREDETLNAVAAIILSVVALEAFINELAEATRRHEAEHDRIRCFAELMMNLERDRESLAVKYKRGFSALCGEACPTGQRPFQDFALLIELRNELVHYKAQTTPYDSKTLQVQYEPSNLIKALVSRRLIAKPSEHGDMAFVSRVGTAAVAAWAHETSVRMIRMMHEAIPPSRFREVRLWIKYPGVIETGGAPNADAGDGATAEAGPLPGYDDGRASRGAGPA